MQRIRRFDIFAIFNKVSKEAEMGSKHAKGYGIWMARMVAGKKFGGGAVTTGHTSAVATTTGAKKSGVKSWHELSGKPQTDKEYDKELVTRFGEPNLITIEDFIRNAYKKGMKYEAIRDCKHYAGKGRFQTGFCPECSNNFKKVFKNILK